MKQHRAILVVDDDLLVLRSLSQQIERHFADDFLLESAQSGEEGLEVIGLLEKEGVELVIVVSDFLMPGMNGDEFARKVKKTYPKLRILLLSGQIEDGQVQQLLNENSIFDFMEKPWKESELISRLNTIIRNLNI